MRKELTVSLVGEAYNLRSYPVLETNLLSYRDWAEKGMTPNSPAVSLIMGLSAVCDLIEEEGGFSKTVERHEIMKNMVRESMEALSIELLTYY